MIGSILAGNCSGIARVKEFRPFVRQLKIRPAFARWSALLV